MNEFYIETKIEGDNISNVIAYGRRNNHDCWNLHISDWRKICEGKTISHCKQKLRDYLISEDKGSLTIDRILNNVRISSTVVEQYEDTPDIENL